jgi:hypothetical protein
MERKPKTPPVLKRDENNKIIDPNQSTEMVNDLMKKLVTETRAHEKENSFHVSKTGRRDIVVHLAVTILPRVNGHTVIGEQEKEFGQWCFVLEAKRLPATPGVIRKALAELCHKGWETFLKMGIVRV